MSIADRIASQSKPKANPNGLMPWADVLASIGELKVEAPKANPSVQASWSDAIAKVSGGR